MKKPKQEKPTLTPLPCPFCGKPPMVGPKKPDLAGNAWGYVVCTHARCHVNPEVSDGCTVADERGSGAYQDLAIKRWNKRANAEITGRVSGPG